MTREEYFELYSNFIRKESEEYFWCTICSESVHFTKPYQIKKHVDSKGHDTNRKSRELNTSVKYANILTAHPEFILVDGHLFCQICKKILEGETPNAKVHFQSKWHQDCIQIQKENESLAYEDASTWNLELCEVLAASGIPLSKLNQVPLRMFLEKSAGRKIQHHTTMQKNHLPTLQTKYEQEMIDYLSDKKIWVSIDETTDKAKRQVAAVVIGTMEEGKHGKVFLFDLVELESANWDTISKLFIKSVARIWPQGNSNAVLLYVTDGAEYMKKSYSDGLAHLFPKMVHLVCVAHNIHRLALKVADQFPQAKAAIMDAKMVFLKSPKRRREFKEAFPTIPLPPSPVEVRWGTFIKASSYYAKNFSAVQKVVSTFDAKESSYIVNAQASMTRQAKTQIGKLSKGFSFLVDHLVKVQTRHLPIEDSLSVVDQITEQLSAINSSILPKKGREEVNVKWTELKAKNVGLRVMIEISKWRKGEVKDLSALEGLKGLHHVPTIAEEDLKYFDYAPHSSAEVERVFSIYGNILTSQRRTTTMDNLKSQILMQWNIKGKQNDSWVVAFINLLQFAAIKGYDTADNDTLEEDTLEEDSESEEESDEEEAKVKENDKTAGGEEEDK